jgi:hypothetical protein
MAEAAAAAAPRIAETLAEGSAERREVAYVEVETATRSALSLSGAARDEPAALAFGSVRPIMGAIWVLSLEAVLCATSPPATSG